MSEMEKILQNWDSADEYLNSKVEENKLPTYTLEEYERVKDSIPVGTKFIITDDEGGDEPEPTPTPSGVNSVNSYKFINSGDSYTISVKDKILTSAGNYKYILLTILLQSDNSAIMSGTGTIAKWSTGEIKSYAYLNGSTSVTDIGYYFNISLDEDKEEITITRNSEYATTIKYILII